MALVETKTSLQDLTSIRNPKGQNSQQMLIIQYSDIHKTYYRQALDTCTISASYVQSNVHKQLRSISGSGEAGGVLFKSLSGEAELHFFCYSATWLLFTLRRSLFDSGMRQKKANHIYDCKHFKLDFLLLICMKYFDQR